VTGTASLRLSLLPGPFSDVAAARRAAAWKLPVRAAAANALPVLAPLLVLADFGAGDVVLLLFAFACAGVVDAAIRALAARRPRWWVLGTFAIALGAGLVLFGAGFALLLALAALATAILESGAQRDEIASALLLLCAAALRVDAGTVALGAVRDLALIAAVAPTALFFAYASEQATLVLGRPRRRTSRALRDLLALVAAAAALGGWLFLAARAGDGLPGISTLPGLLLLVLVGAGWLWRDGLAARLGGFRRATALLALLALAAFVAARLALVHPPGLPLPF